MRRGALGQYARRAPKSAIGASRKVLSKKTETAPIHEPYRLSISGC